MKIMEANTVEDIYEVLKTFEEHMPRLAAKVGSYYSYAEKLSKNAHFLFAKDEGEILGFISFYANDFISCIGFISLIIVSSKVQKKGIGALLLNGCFRRMKESGMAMAKLEVEKTNSNAIAFYKHMGFELIGLNGTNGYKMQRKI